MPLKYRLLASGLAVGLLLLPSLGHGSATGRGSSPGRAPPAVRLAGPAAGTYIWPVRGPVLRGFEPPETPFGAGHRGIDIGAPLGTPIRAAGSGTVAFAGWVAGSLFISIDHPDGVRTTYSWVSEVAVASGAPVERGDVIGRTGPGHPGVDPPHLHFGARVGSTYLDPMLLLGRGSLVGLVHLAPLDERVGGPPA